jgi:hypothetical protein
MKGHNNWLTSAHFSPDGKLNTDASLHLAEHLCLGNPQLAQRIDEALLVLHQKTPPEATTIQTNKPTEEHGRDRK